MIRRAYAEALAADPTIGEAFRSDIAAFYDRDPACDRFLDPVLYFKGFHAIQTHRLAHWLIGEGRARLRAITSRAARRRCFQVTSIRQPDRPRLFFDHATAIVVGETAVIEDDVSILQGVTLGGTGKETGDRHPKIRRGVLIGAGAKILGNIEVGQCSRVAAGSVVLKTVPPCTTVAGVPARVVGEAGCADPARAMQQTFRMRGRASDPEGRRAFFAGRSLEGGFLRAPVRARRLARRIGVTPVTKDELAKIERYLRRTLQSPTIIVKARPRKTDSAEVYAGEEFIGVVFEDDEDDEKSYNFQMAILGMDLED